MSTLTDTERAAAVEAVRQALAPDMPFQTYAQRVGAFHAACLNRFSKDFLEQRPESKDAGLASNAGKFETVSFEYKGLKQK